MRTLTGVVDANVIIGLAKGGVFDLLSFLYGTLYVPRSVREEIVGQGQGLAGEQELLQALGVWITEVISDPQTVQQFSAALSSADREVLAVAQTYGVDHILSGDRQLGQHARSHGLTCLRASDVVVIFKRRGLVTDVKSVLDRMRQHGFGIANFLYEEALRAAGEWPSP